MPPATTHTIHCPHCRQGLRVPGDRGRLRVRCAGCSAEFEFQPPSPSPPPVPPPPAPASTVPPPMPPPVPAADGEGGWVQLLLGVCAPLGVALAIAFLDLRVQGWVEFVIIMGCVLFVPVWIIRGLRGVSGLAWPGAIALGGIAYVVVLVGSSWIATLGPDGGLGPGHFSGLDPEQTSLAELDDAMEDW